MESFLCVVVESGNGTTILFLESLPALGNVYEKGKVFEIIESTKPWRNKDNPFGLKRFFSCIKIPDNILA